MDFFWINRDQKSFEWFVKLLSQLEIEQSEQDGVMGHFLDMHMYITSALQRTDMKAVGLQLALDLLHEKVSIWLSVNFFFLEKSIYYFEFKGNMHSNIFWNATKNIPRARLTLWYDLTKYFFGESKLPKLPHCVPHCV